MGRLLRSAAAFVVALGLASCGGDDDSGQTATSSVPSPTASASAEVGDVIDQIVAAQQDVETLQFQMYVVAGDEETEASGALQFNEASTGLDMSVTLNDGTAAVLVDDVLYLKLPPDAGAPTPWVRLDSEGGDPTSRQMAAALEQLQFSADPERYSEVFAAASSIERGGEDVVDGVRVTEYLITVDVTELPDHYLGGFPAEDLPFDEVSYSFWIDGANLIRRITSDLAGYGEMDVRYFGYGEPVDIVAPPADQVSDLAELVP